MRAPDTLYYVPEIARAYGAERTPEIFHFDKGGTLHYHGTVDDNYGEPAAARNHYLIDALEAVLGGREPATTATAPVGCTIKWMSAAYVPRSPRVTGRRTAEAV